MGKDSNMSMATCRTCGGNYLAERASLGIAYCTRKECVQANLQPLEIVAVGVNKAAPGFVLKTPEAEADVASGRFTDQRRGTYGRTKTTVAAEMPRTPGKTVYETIRPRRLVLAGTLTQRKLARAYNREGLRVDQISEMLGLTRYEVTQIILAGKRSTGL